MAMRVVLTAVFLSLALGGCGQPSLMSRWSPKPAFLSGLPEDDSDYSQGLRAGCAQALGTVGDGMARLYGFGYEPNEGIEDREYYRGYVIGQNHCTYFANRGPI